jgi:hypothetical protein
MLASINRPGQGIGKGIDGRSRRRGRALLLQARIISR